MKIVNTPALSATSPGFRKQMSLYYEYHKWVRRTDVYVANQAIIVTNAYTSVVEGSAAVNRAVTANLQAIVPLLETLVERNFRRLLVPMVTWNI